MFQYNSNEEINQNDRKNSDTNFLQLYEVYLNLKL